MFTLNENYTLTSQSFSRSSRLMEKGMDEGARVRSWNEDYGLTGCLSEGMGMAPIVSGKLKILIWYKILLIIFEGGNENV